MRLERFIMADTIFDKLRQKEKNNRKKAIVEVAEDILRNDGLEFVTVRNVAKKAGLSSGAIYMYFKSKEELLLSMLIQNLKILKQEMGECVDKNNPVDAIKNMGYKYRQYFSRFGKYINILGLTTKDEDKFKGLDSVMLDELEKILSELLSQLQEVISDVPLGGIFKNLPPDRSVPLLWALIQGLVQITTPSPHIGTSAFDFDQVMDDVTLILSY